MIRIATIGTSKITRKFIKNAEAVPEVAITASYSRSMEKAKVFGAEFGISRCYDDLNELAADAEIDAVYISSPNSLHYSQTIQMLKAGKHVLCEKSLASNLKEAEEMFQTAKENNVILLEALRTLHDPAFQTIKENLYKLGTIRKACLEYCQYSSRYDAFQKGDIQNIFKKELSAGALMDIGVYCLQALLDLFGTPEATTCYPVFLSNGIDGAGTIHATYPGMVAEISYSKITRSDNCSQIQGEKATMYIEEIPNPRKIWIIYTDGRREEIEVSQGSSNLNFEIAYFARAIQSGTSPDCRNSLEYYKAISLKSSEIQDSSRKQIGLRFPADQKEQ